MPKQKEEAGAVGTTGKMFLAIALGVLVGVGTYYGFFSEPKTATVLVEITDPAFGDSIYRQEGLQALLEGKPVFLERMDGPDAGKYLKGFSDTGGKVIFDRLPVPSKWKVSVKQEKTDPFLTVVKKEFITLHLGKDAYTYDHVVMVKGGGEVVYLVRFKNGK